ncbi:hypothetical protein C8F01DRAFT_1026009, partial [Mycena amicta]
LDVQHPQLVLNHIAAHYHHDDAVDKSQSPCGLCGRAWPLCVFKLKKTSSNALTIDLNASSGCPNLVKALNLGAAAKSLPNSPSSNVLLHCPLCSAKDPAVWKYNLSQHLRVEHSPDSVARYKDLWSVTDDEKERLDVIYSKISDGKNAVKKVKKPKRTLLISEAHSSKLAL